MGDDEHIIKIHKHIQKLAETQQRVIDELVLVKQEVASIKRIITEGLVEDSQIRGHTDKLFNAVMELQQEQPNALTHRLYDRERLQ